MPERTDAELVERLLTGGPRVSDRAWRALQRRAGADLDVAGRLPPQAELAGDVATRAMNLRRIAWCRDEDTEALLSDWASLQGPKRREPLLVWGRFGRSAHLADLLPPTLSVVADPDPDVADAALYALGMWIRQPAAPIESIVPALLAAIADTRRSKVGKRKLSAIAREGLLAATWSAAAADFVQPHLEPLLDAKSAAERRIATEFCAYRATRVGDAEAMADLLAHPDRTVRSLLSKVLRTSDRTAAKRILSVAVQLPPPARAHLADELTRGMCAKHVEPAEARALRSRILEGAPDERLAAVESAAGLSIDLTDLRTCAPHLALALFDEDARVRDAAALTIATVTDMQSRVTIVSATADLIERAMERASGASRASLDVARESLRRRR